MKMFDKLVNFFTYEEDENEVKKNNDRETEKSSLKRELMEERKKYAKTETFSANEISSKEKLEPVKKQVMFVDETFDRQEKSAPNEQVFTQAPKYTDTNEKKFKPTSYISPVHGLIKEAEEIAEFETQAKTTSESDYAKIRDKAFGNAVFSDEIEELEKGDAKFFATNEIIDLQKRMQIDNSQVLDKDLSVEEAAKRAEQTGESVNSKSFTEQDENPQYLFDLLDELKEDSKDE